ncbi:MAG: phage holin family protein [Gemmatimonadales bacterium]|jgi:putative membrane protein
MRGLLARVLITAFGLWMADSLLADVSFDDVVALWISALLLGLVNAFVRPVVLLLTLPFTILTLGLFVFVINGAMLLLVAAVTPSFHVEGWWAAILASIIVGLTAWIANGLVGNKGTIEVWTTGKRNR